MKNFGYKLSRKDKRGYSFHKTFGAVKLIDFPLEYSVRSKFPIHNQNAEGLPNGCTAYTVIGLCQDQDDIEYDVKKQYEAALKRANLPDNSPMTLDDAFAIPVKIGLWPKGKENVSPGYYRKSAYYTVDGPHDHFDNIRSALLLNTSDKRAVGAGHTWYQEFQSINKEGIALSNPQKALAGHSPIIDGWKWIKGKPYLCVESHQGSNYGDNGYIYYSRELTNKLFGEWGSHAVTIKDAPEGEVQRIEISLWQQLLDILKQFYYLIMQKESIKIVESKSEPPKIDPIKLESRYLWDTKENAKHSVRVICDEEKLAIWEKNLICAVIQAESDFNNEAINRNKNHKGDIISTDWGLCQINDYYQIGPGKPFTSIEEILKTPDKAVRWMIKMYKAKKLNLWVAYSSEAYRKYL